MSTILDIVHHPAFLAAFAFASPTLAFIQAIG